MFNERHSAKLASVQARDQFLLLQSADRFKIFGVNFNRCALIDQVDRKNKLQLVLLSYEHALNTLHHAAPDSDSFAHHQIAIRFQC